MFKSDRLKRFIEIGCIATDTPEERLKKSIMTIMVVPYALAAIIWGSYFMRNGFAIAGTIPLAYAAVSLTSFFYFIYTKRYNIFRFFQVFLVLILPFCLQLTLGGFSQSSGMLLWSCTAPFIALVFYDMKTSIKWVYALLFLLVLACLLDESARTYFPEERDENAIVLVYGANFILISILLFGIQTYFVNAQRKIKIQLEEKEELLEASREIDRQKELLLATKDRLELVMGSLEEVVWGQSLPDYKMQYVSDSVINLYGLPKQNWFENSNLWFERIHPDDKNRVTEFNKNLFANGTSYQDYRIITPNEEIKWINSKVRILKDKDGTPFFMTGIAHDITDKKDAEEELFHLNNNLEEKVRFRTEELSKSKNELAKALVKEKELGQLKSSFVTVASHQFRTPLAVIQSNTELLTMLTNAGNNSDPVKYRNVTDRITSAISKMTDLMDDVLTLGKLTAGKVSYNPKEIDLVDFCRKMVEEFNAVQLDGRNIDFVYSGEIYQPYLDSKLLEHSLSNLINNAFKYSVGNEKPELSISFKSTELVISIKDYGVGIPEDERKHLFEPFFRAENVSEIQGTGLGLSIAKEYIEVNKGNIVVKSTLEKGSDFEITFAKERI